MAEINTSTNQKKRGLVKRATKKDTRVDLTPMVDLGFLLITFFVLTTTMAKPKVLKLAEPMKSNIKTKVPESLTTTFLLSKENRVYYRHGLLQDYSITDFSDAGVRKVIADKRNLLGSVRKDSMIVVIKPADLSNMQNFVDIMDEIAISGLKIYFVDELNAADKDFLAKH